MGASFGLEPPHNRPNDASNAAGDAFLDFSEEALQDTLFEEERESVSPLYWKVLLVDDEESVHSVTRLVLDNTVFLGRRLEILSAYSAEEGLALATQHPDLALALVDVVMESDRAGLDFVHKVRTQLNWDTVRLVLRTGQPGMAPEREVIAQYDINGYYQKTDLTAEKLYTLIYTGLRSYRDILLIRAQSQALEKIIETGRALAEIPSVSGLFQGILRQLAWLFDYGHLLLCVEYAGNGSDMTLLAYHQVPANQSRDTLLDANTRLRIAAAAQTQSSENCVSECDYFVLHLFSPDKRHFLVYAAAPLLVWDQELTTRLLSVFTRNVQSLLHNAFLHEEIEETQRELIYRFGEAVESRSKETGNHVRRVAHLSELLGLKAGMSAEDAYLLKLASPMHDLGKIAIPDAILHKPAKLDPDEWAIMQTHAEQGYQILHSSTRPLLQVAATLAHEHHEKWDGSGYPRQIAGEAISLVGRITAVADVYDALSSHRAYKKPWSTADIQTLFQEQSGKHFDPQLVDILLRDYTEFEYIRSLYPDTPDAHH